MRSFVLKLALLLAAAWVAGLAGEARAQYYGYPVPYYGYYPRPVFYNADGYLRQGLYNTRRFYNLGSAENYLRGGLANTAYFYGL